MRVFAQRSAAYASNSEIFLFWMVGTSSILLIVAVLFLRNQIKPILRLADAAESFGKGREAPNFRPRGAREVRRAAQAFLEMKARIERSIEQRTAMLAGVSHDLRTILTRFKLELALIGDSPEVDGMRKDVDEMSAMLEAYLAFARGDCGEHRAADRHGGGAGGIAQRRRAPRPHRDRGVPRPAGGDREAGLVQALPRQPRLQRGAPRQRDCDHRPPRSPLSDRDGRRRRPRHSAPTCARKCSSRSCGSTTPATRTKAAPALGLAIARDIARSHGGDITLGDSPMGGLRAAVRMPV